MTLFISFILLFFSHIPASNQQNSVIPNELAEHLLALSKEKLASFYPNESYKFQIELKRIPNSINKIAVSEIEDIVFVNPISPKGYERAQIVTKQQGVNSNYSNQLQLYIKVWQKLPLLKESKQAAEPIQEQDFFTDWYDVTRLSGHFIDDLNQVDPNLVLARMLQKGQPIRAIDLAKQAVIEAGENITLVMSKSGFTIQILCIARQAGAIGEEIRCYSEENRKTYAATIIQKGLVQWKQTY
jgi:flagella basal body P-ring formation protein FlgA